MSRLYGIFVLLSGIMMIFVFVFCISSCGNSSGTEQLSLNKNTIDKAVIDFSTHEINLGTIPSDTLEKIIVFKFKNTGSNALLLSKLKTSCSCVVADYPSRPLKPQEEGEIKIKLSTKGLNGYFNKSIYVKSNAVNAYEVLYIKGRVS